VNHLDVAIYNDRHEEIVAAVSEFQILTNYDAADPSGVHAKKAYFVDRSFTVVEIGCYARYNPGWAFFPHNKGFWCLWRLET
jgi:hypothetical protein